MDSDGGSANTLLRCPRDDVDTRLQCSECGTPICPACFVRTAVGLRCANCGAGKPVLSVGSVGDRRPPILAAVAVVVALFVAGGVWAATRGSGGPAGDIGGGDGQRAVVPLVQIGSGDRPGGMTWTLEARRDGEVCATMRTSPGPTARERCQRVISRAINNSTTRAVRGPSGTIFLTVAQVTDRVERGRVTSGDAEPREIPTLGKDAGLGVRFFVTYSTENVDESYDALAADGSRLGGVRRPKMPDR